MTVAFKVSAPVTSSRAEAGTVCKRRRANIPRAALSDSDTETRTQLRGRHVVVSGGTGLIGRALVPALRGAGCDVTVLARKPTRVRGARAEYFDAATGTLTASTRALLKRADVVVNLAGEPIDSGRWTPARKAALRASRVRGTYALGAATPEHARIVQASAIGYYGAGRVGTCVEDTPAPPTARGDFLSTLATEWEAAAGERATICRFGVVLSDDGGALPKMAGAFRAWLGGAPGGGSQWFSWVHREDVVRFLMRAIAADEDENLNGPYNVCAPNPVTLAEFCSALAQALDRPCWAPIPAVAIKALMGEEAAQLVLQGQRVIPQRALRDGFVFKHPDVRAAVAHAIGAPAAVARQR